MTLGASSSGRVMGLRLPPSAREMALFAEELLGTVRRTHAPRRVIEEVQRARLRRVLAAAQRTRLSSARVSSEAAHAGRLDHVPPVTKHEFLANLEETIVDGALSNQALAAFVRAPERAGTLLDDRYVVAMTSGTTGQVGIFVNDVESWARTRAAAFGRIFQAKLTARDVARALGRGRTRLVFVVATGGHYMTALLASRVPPVGRLVVDAQAISVEMPLPVLVSRLNALDPHILHSYPTLLELLAAEQRAGRLTIHPDVVTSGSERLSDRAATSIRAAFPGASIVETYAATECVPLAASCAHGTLHVNDDACVLEPVDDAGHPVPPGEVSAKVLITNLLNTTQPLVRYVLTDQVEVLVERCRCGSALTPVRVHGRTDDTFFLRASDGSWQAHPPIPLELLFLAVAGLLQYQLIHETQNSLRVLFVVEKGAQGAQVAALLDDKFARYLSEHDLLDEVSYTLEQVDRIERHESSRKIRQILSKVAPPIADARQAPEVRERRRRPRGEE